MERIPNTRAVFEIHIIEGDIGVGKSTLLQYASHTWGISVQYEMMSRRFVKYLYSTDKELSALEIQTVILNQQTCKYINCFDVIREAGLHRPNEGTTVLMERGFKGTEVFARKSINNPTDWGIFITRWNTAVKNMETHKKLIEKIIGMNISINTTYLLGNVPNLMKNIKTRGRKHEIASVTEEYLFSLQAEWRFHYGPHDQISWKAWNSLKDIHRQCDQYLAGILYGNECIDVEFDNSDDGTDE